MEILVLVMSFVVFIVILFILYYVLGERVNKEIKNTIGIVAILILCAYNISFTVLAPLGPGNPGPSPNPVVHKETTPTPKPSPRVTPTNNPTPIKTLPTPPAAKTPTSTPTLTPIPNNSPTPTPTPTIPSPQPTTSSVPTLPPVQPTPKPPTLLANTFSLSSTDTETCPFDSDRKVWICTITLKEDPNSTGSLTWWADSPDLPGVTFSPTTGSINGGESSQVAITIPASSCKPSIFNFNVKGGKTVEVIWWCKQQIPLPTPTQT